MSTGLRLPRLDKAADLRAVDRPRPAILVHQDAGNTPYDPRTRRTALPAAFLLALAAGAAFHRVYHLRAVLPVAALAAAAPLLLSALLSAPRRDGTRAGMWRSMLATPVVWALAVWGLLYRGSTPSAGLVRTVGTDLLDAPHRVLTTIAPVPSDGALLILPFTTVWLAAYASAELALRTRAVLVPALPPLAVLALACVLGAGGPGGNTVPAAAFAGAVVLLVLTRAPRRHAPSRVRRLAALPLVAVPALVAALAAPALLHDRTPLSPRDEAAAPDPLHVVGGNPLDMVGAWLLDPLRPLFLVKATAATPDDSARLADHDWRLAVFGGFDGITWSPSSRLAPTGGRIPDAPAARDGVRTVTLDQHVTVQQLGGVWLPSSDRPGTVTGAPAGRLAIDTDSGAVATTTPLRDGDTYTVTAHVPLFDATRVQYAPTADDPAMTRLPDSPTLELMRAKAQEATAGSRFPYQQALRLAAWLRDNHVFDVNAVPGHTYRSLEFFLKETKRGTSEQFTTAFAVMARSLGLPTRVVVGFHHGEQTPGGWQVTGQDAVVWPEVEFAGVGWVPFQPTPGERMANVPAPPAAPAVPQGAAPPSAPPAPAGAQRQADDQKIIGSPHTNPPRPDTVAAGHDGGGTDWRRWSVIGGGAVAGVALAVAVWRALGPWRRRAKERRGTPAAQTLAAWRRIGASLHRLGMPDPATLTAEEVATWAVAHLLPLPRKAPDPAASLPSLAALVNEIAYAGRQATPAEAAAAWREAATVRKACQATAKANRRGGRAAAGEPVATT
ncbi:transglutaminaseTgpA domain-containing protein [Yinghuangia seranimata]|uniref:transglutaminase family protein n=1 Tax=Yinghuangia seranimata TaxID=408067 RepID=UPI00248B108A|nr:transglutaminase domain-containing protein [Yinghuangia seranimata]MDI2125813.1 transglutaminaseTgpA domain-containing protein [Yinghuangia seranimata]